MNHPSDPVLDNVFLHRGMVPAVRSRARDAIFEAQVVLSSLEHAAQVKADLERVRADLSRLEHELPSLSLVSALKRAEALRHTASSLYERTIKE